MNSNIEKVYHYTKLETFYKIWKSKKLLFGSSDNVNDLDEISHNYTFQPNCPLPDILKKVKQYRQVSLSMDYSEKSLVVCQPHCGGIMEIVGKGFV